MDPNHNRYLVMGKQVVIVAFVTLMLFIYAMKQGQAVDEPMLPPNVKTPPPWSEKLKVSGSPLHVVPFVLGYEPIPESISVLGGSPSRFLLEPVTAVYSDGWVLLDSGFPVDIIRDSEQRAAHFNYESYTVPPGDPLVNQVAAADLQWEKLLACVLSHAHLDHTGGLVPSAERVLMLLPPSVPVIMQREEWNWLASGAGLNEAVFVDTIMKKYDNIHLINGDTELAPGLLALNTSGHTPGHQSFLITLPEAKIVYACDAADLRRNIDERIACGSFGRPEDQEKAQRAIERLADLDNDGYQVWPGHDPDWWVWKMVSNQTFSIHEFKQQLLQRAASRHS